MICEVLDALSAPAGPEDPRSLAERRAEAMKDLFAQALAPTGVATDARHEAPVEVPDPWTDSAQDKGTEPFLNVEVDQDPVEGDPTDDDPADDDTDDDDSTDGPAAEAVHEGEPVPAPCTSRSSGRSGRSVAGRALVAVTMDLDWLRRGLGHGLLDSEYAVSPETARRLACDAAIVPTVLGSRSEPLDVGRLSYTVPESLRRALVLRDGGCAFPGCTRRPQRCHAHHLEHWIDGGPTSLDNTCLLCRFHHQLIHHDHWKITMTHGRPWFTPPTWIDPNRQPRPGGRFPVAAG